jgi:hypothetical protein
MNQERQRLIAKIRRAETPEQIKAAKAAAESWLVDHPQDIDIKILVGYLLKVEAVRQ